MVHNTENGATTYTIPCWLLRQILADLNILYLRKMTRFEADSEKVGNDSLILLWGCAITHAHSTDLSVECSR